jgi:hypothetical protein
MRESAYGNIYVQLTIKQLSGRLDETLERCASDLLKKLG